MRRSPWVLVLLLTLSAPASALEPPPVPVGELTGSVHGGFDRISQFAVRSDGRVYIADEYNHRLIVYDPDGNYLEQIGSHGPDLGQFDVIGGLAFDAEGDLFVANQAADRITKLSPTHLPLMQFGTSGTGPGQLRGPDNMFVSPYNGYLYVTELFGDRVSIFDTDGNFIDSFGSTGSGPGQFSHPAGIVVDESGDVFVADQFNHRIQHFDATGTYLSQWGGFGSAPGQFNYSVGLAFDQAGNIYATDQLNNRVQKFQHDGTLLTVWGSFGDGPGEMYNPWAVQPLSNGMIWVGDTWNHRVSIYGPGAIAQQGSGEARGLAVPPPASDLEAMSDLISTCDLQPPPAPLRDLYGYVHGGFDRISQMARRSDGRIYIADEYNHRLVVYGPSGNYLEQIGSHGSALGQFDVIGGLAFDAQDNLFAANQAGDRITKLSPSHLPLMQFGTTGSGPGQLRGPDNMVVSLNDARVHVTELFGDRVSVFDTDGNFLTSFGSTGTGPGQFDHPAGIVIDEAGDVFVADQYNHRIERFDHAGAYQMEWGGFGSAPGKFNYAVGLGLDEDGNVFATDQLNNRVQKFERDGTLLTLWGSFGNEPGEMYNPWAVLPLPDGEIWVGDTFNYRISVYGPGGATPYPRILSIEDVPEDNGFQVRIRFLASSFDVAGSTKPILQYEAFRRIDPPLAGEAIGQSPVESDNSTLLAGWEFVGAVPAHAEDEYNMVAPTVVNSKHHQTRYSVFFLRAATAVPAEYFDSCPDSGASTDDLPPAAPQAFQALLQESGDVALTWEANEEVDLLDYSLYRGTTSDFAPSASTLIATVTDPGYSDLGAAASGQPIFYKLSAWDDQGNESGYALASIEGTVSSPTVGTPTQFALFPAAPNPTAESATIQFDLPIPCSATMFIFDVHGRLVRALGGGVIPAGRHRWEWNGRDAEGSRVPAGIYFYRLRTPFFSKTLRIAVTG